MKRITFHRNPSCTACDLHETCKSVCIGARPLFPARGRPRVLYIVGTAPGVEEDFQAEAFVGQSGRILRDWIDSCNLHSTTDVFLGNVVRCRPPGNADPTAKSIRSCRQYLERDLTHLAGHYEALLLLIVGGSACKALLGVTMKKAFRTQGSLVETN